MWQMQDPSDGNWLTLPILMQQHADKSFAQYQLQVYEATKKLERKEIRRPKFDAIVNNCVRPLVLMHATGAPATAKYIKDHLQKAADGTMRLKAHLLYKCSNI